MRRSRMGVNETAVKWYKAPWQNGRCWSTPQSRSYRQLGIIVNGGQGRRRVRSDMWAQHAQHAPSAVRVQYFGPRTAQDRLSAARMMTAPFQPLRNLPHASHSLVRLDFQALFSCLALLHLLTLSCSAFHANIICHDRAVRARRVPAVADGMAHSRYQSVHCAIATEQMLRLCTICHPSYATLAWRLILSRCPSQTPWTLFSMSDARRIISKGSSFRQ